ncbi:MAG: hypothetical protein J0H69_16890 [Burkholderiales bacterium]|nr:hypothetical protein [Burkholderiales bacterium]
MNLQTVLDDMVAPAQQILGIARTPQSDLMLLAIGLQESRFEHRRQIGGPAVGFWQFEKGGGVRGVLTHHTSVARAAKLCAAQGVGANEAAVYGALPLDDILAAGFARLLLLTDPRPLPALDDVDGAWAYYLRNWRPGKPHARTWPALYLQAREALS